MNSFSTYPRNPSPLLMTLSNAASPSVALISPLPATPVSQALAFKTQHAAYFFEDAHFLVEGDASRVAKEVSYNVFQFPDGSILRIDNRRCTVEGTAAP